ncbi:uncharacterized protein N7503_009681 [Penicillium pulvis]|uniref:uncharacterized protein n=1 Tax=Penicillium pulvis TaxID=1562058 RepID=UPI0025468ECE|nr:uncharacterized protein N7503_009681 [Penicillium pulvis]KAJ5784469.1 hypothetical protein N7503_009681 [Penicillium pulvis]
MKVISVIIVTALAALPSAAMGTVEDGGACTTTSECRYILSECENGVCTADEGLAEFAKGISEVELAKIEQEHPGSK